MAYGGVVGGILRLLAISVALVGAILFLFWLTQRRMMYFPSGGVPTPAQVGLGRTEVVSFATDDGLLLAGWFVRTDRPSAGTVLVFNGNAGNRAYRLQLRVDERDAAIELLVAEQRDLEGQ